MKILKNTVAAVMLASMILSFGACTQGSKNQLENIKLTETERSWSNSDAKYGKLLEQYGKNKCAGTFVVATDKDIVYLYCENELEKDGKTVVSQNTVFDIASCSKTFTAVCILQLMEKGKLSLEDTLDKYFPEYETGKKITISNLLHMSSGIPDYMNNPDPFWNISGADAANKQLSDILQDRTTDEEFMKALCQAKLLFEPGTKYGYSNTNYRLLAFIIEKLSGMKYCDYVKKNIFDKCGMKTTTSMATGDMTYVPVGYEDQVKYGFSDKDGYPACPNNCRGDGGIHSNLTDMVKFDRALFAGKLLNKSSMEILLKEENGYCCGLQKDRTGYSHSGSSISCSANNKIIESEEFGHIYIIKLTHDSKEPENPVDPAAGTKYTKGVFKQGYYTNEYAGIKLKVPSNFEKFLDADLEWVRKDAVASCIDDDDKAMELARKYDTFFFDSNGSVAVIMITFINTKLAVPDELDYTAEAYLKDSVDQMLRRNEADPDRWEMKRGEITKVTLGGKEYSKLSVEYDFQGHGTLNYYARKLDNDLIAVIQITLGNQSVEDYEKLFE